MTDAPPICPKPTIPFIPLSSLPDVVGGRKEHSILKNSLSFSSKVGPGWISYNPNKMTVLTANDTFNPLYPTPSILNIEKQIIKVTNQHELRQLEFMFTKPALMCVTRRQKDELGLHGFDTDFVLVLNPQDSLVANHFQIIKDYMRKQIKRGRKFFVAIDFSSVLNDILPLNFKRYVSWFNARFFVTNHCRPNPVLGLDSVVVCCALTPLALLVTLPYKVFRKHTCVDKTLPLDVGLRLEYNDLSPLILHFFNEYVPAERPHNYKYKNKLFSRLCSSEELRTLIDLLDTQEGKK